MTRTRIFEPLTSFDQSPFIMINGYQETTMPMQTRGMIRDDIAQKDCEVITQKNATYKDSFAKRGGVGAFMMLARKWDRIEAILEDPEVTGISGQRWDKYDMFQALAHQQMSTDDGKLLAEIQDLRRYLLLIEEYCRHAGWSDETYGESNRGHSAKRHEDPYPEE